MYRAFFAELEKIAAGPHIFEYDHPDELLKGFPELHGKGPAGALMYEKSDLSRLPQHIQGQLHPGRPVLVLPSRHHMTQAMQGNHTLGNDLYDVVRRHEMTHYMQLRKGQLPADGERGLAAAAKVLKAELGANLSSLKARLSPSMGSKIKGVVGVATPLSAGMSTHAAIKGMGGYKTLFRR